MEHRPCLQTKYKTASSSSRLTLTRAPGCCARKSLIDQALPEILRGFYTQVRKTPEVARFFPNEKIIDHAAHEQAKHWGVIANAAFDENFSESVKRVGRTHARIGLEPRWYIGGYAFILEGLVRAVIEDAAKSKTKLDTKGAANLSADIGALVKAALLDMDFAVSVYLEEEASKRQELEDERAITQAAQKKVVDALAAGLKRVANCDLTARIDLTFEADYEVLRRDFNDAVAGLRAGHDRG